MSERLRIAQIAPVARAVAPDSPSSIEQLVALLCEGLARRGHDVTLFATAGSNVGVPVHSVYASGYLDDTTLWKNWEFHEVCNAAAAFERDFDVIHSHSYHYALPFAGLSRGAALVSTYHVNPDPDILCAYARHPQVHVVAVSDHHRSKFAGLDGVTTILNGVDTSGFPFSPEGGDYLLFLGHLIEKKGPVEGIAVARAAGMPLVMAGAAGDYYDQHVAHLVDGEEVRHIGKVVDPAQRNRLLAGAAALLFPSVRAEPFGLVLVEAMACGTPIAALDRCAVPEIVTPGVSGHYAADVAGLAALLPDVVALDRAGVRAEAVARFDAARMVDDHEAFYRELVGR